MKKIYTKVKLTNYEDMVKEASGIITSSQIRAVEMEARVDTGSTHLSIPEDICDKIGLRKIWKTKVKYADGRWEEKYMGSVVLVEIKGISNRTAIARPVIEPPGTEILIGNPVLEDMDVFVNTKTGEIYPNPESPDMPLVELY